MISFLELKDSYFYWKNKLNSIIDFRWSNTPW
jgi:hypothetical protein